MVLCVYVGGGFCKFFFFFQAEDGIRDGHVTGVQTCALPIYVGAALVLDHGGEEAVTNSMLGAYPEENGYPIDDVAHEFMSLEGSFRRDLERAKSVVQGWLEEVDAARRTEVPASELRI